MSVDVLGELKELRDDHLRAGDYSGEGNYFYRDGAAERALRDWDRVISSVAELIAADREYDAAKHELAICHANDPKRHERSVRLSVASQRRAAAIAAVTGEVQG